MNREVNEIVKRGNENSGTESRGRSSSPVGPIGIILLGAYLILFSCLLLYGLMYCWPESSPDSPTSSPAKLSIFGGNLDDESLLLLIVAMAGALGSMVHAIRSFYWYVGHGELVRSWMWKYILLPFVGAILALAFYMVFRGGLFSPSADLEQVRPFGFAAMAVLVGMFSEQALLKLKKVANTLFTKPEQGANAVPPGPAEKGNRNTER